jgi:hypothetical protein
MSKMGPFADFGDRHLQVRLTPQADIVSEDGGADPAAASRCGRAPGPPNRRHRRSVPWPDRYRSRRGRSDQAVPEVGALEQRQAANLRASMSHGLRQVHPEAGTDLFTRSAEGR